MVVLEEKPSIVAEKEPVPDVFWTLVFEMVGLLVVPQTIPLSVTLAPPSAVTFPPKSAETVVTNVCVVVVTVGVLIATAVITTKSSIDQPPSIGDAGVNTISSILANEPVVGDVKSKVISELWAGEVRTIVPTVAPSFFPVIVKLSTAFPMACS